MSNGRNKIFTTLGASNHSSGERAKDDYYATDPKAMHLLLELEDFNPRILECACGEGHLSKVLKEKGYKVTSRDLVYRGFGKGGKDFLKRTKPWPGDIFTNPPYTLARAFIEKALELIPTGNRVAMFLKLQFLENKGKKDFFNTNPPKLIYVSRSRIKCAKNGDFGDGKKGKAVAYCWFIWEKGYKGFPTIKWFN